MVRADYRPDKAACGSLAASAEACGRSMAAQRSALRWIAGTLIGVAVFVPPASAQDRGELLYATHCGACHTAQMHWRASRAVTDWKSLIAQVRKWQVAASLAWREEDVLDVARYLNQSIYHFKPMESTSSSTRIHEEPYSLAIHRRTSSREIASN